MTSRDDASLGASPSTPDPSGALPPTYAAFSPVTLSGNTPSRSARTSTILVHQKSPLLLATPPQVTRALAYSHPFLLPLNFFVGLLTWSTGDSWQSFLVLCAFWAVVLYGDVVVRTAGPVVVGVGLIAGMYGRRYSPLSTSGWSEPAREGQDGGATVGATTGQAKATAAEKQAKKPAGSSEVTKTKHQKTLDEIVETLKEFTGRCNTLMEPLLEMTDFLSTQRTATSATTKPALTAMFMRLLIITPFWVALTFPPWRIITTRRVILVSGTLMLSWHARPVRVARTLLWRSATIRRIASAITGLHFETPTKAALTGDTGSGSKAESALTKALRKSSSLQVTHRRAGSKSSGVKFTFIIYENQRRWVGLGWTTSLFAYERSAWTDEHNNAVPQKDEFELPEVEDGSHMQWQWAEGSRWRVDGVPDDHGPVEYDGEEGRNGWVFYDNKWQNGRRGQDGWGRWTRRRKWYRDAELVEVDESEVKDTASTSSARAHQKSYSTAGEKMVAGMRSEPSLPLPSQDAPDTASVKTADDAASLHSTSSRSFFMRRRPTDKSTVEKEKEKDKEKEAEKDKGKGTRSRRESEVLDDDTSGLGFELELELQKQGKEGGEWGIGDEARMNLE